MTKSDKAVLFDLDGTLVDSERDNVESVVLAARQHGAELSADLRKFVVGHSWNEIYTRIQAEHALPLSMDALIALAVEKKRVLVATKGYQALPGAEALVRRLSTKVPLAVVSGASCVEVREAVEGIGLTSYFQVLLGAEDYQKGKPDPEPFLMGMGKVGATPGGCIVIEDSLPGILAGKAAGMKVIAVAAGNFLGYDQSAADVQVSTLEEVTDALCDRLWG
jgi:HAD superfamily hydrolase (TIGR01509 family)